MLSLGSLADSLETYARQIRSVADIISEIEKDQQTNPGFAARAQKINARVQNEKTPIIQQADNNMTQPGPGAACDTRDLRESDHNAVVGWRPLPTIPPTNNVIDSHAAPVDETICPDAVLQRILATRQRIPRAIESRVQTPQDTPPTSRAQTPQDTVPPPPRARQHPRLTVLLALTILIAFTSPLV